MRWGLVLIFLVLIGCAKDQKKKEEKKVEEKPLTEVQIKKIRKEINADKKAQLIEEAFKKKGNFNGTILVAQKGVILFQKATGFAKDTIPNTMDSKFQLASLSKTFTALAIMKMVQEGKLGLENTIQDIYPNFPYSGVTIRSLLSHRSGLPYYQYEFDSRVRRDKIYPTNQQIMQWFIEANPAPKMINKPDHFFAYNNTNYAILAAIIEKVSGQSFAQYMEENIFKPAGMNHTFAGTSTNPELQKNKTQGYQNGRKLDKDFFDDIMGDKGIYSTAPDLLKYYNVLKSGSIVSKENLREMYTPRSFEHPGIRNYGYGFRLWVNKLQQTDYIYHTGWWKGYNTIMFFDLRDDFVIILLSNKYNRSVYNIREMVDILHDEKKRSSLEENILDQ
ncbi:serine hydrolase domain-containing protein [Leadbetterella byssophila]|uniref:Beta-lactamase n=1 Tax=Leadbetterella byssophila (strain DSM 17132 / JCM 16389 / KACC 11308 / NBRC 106382 / 4M15) TaxID=649349 RepID=E4RRF0_LEAB4|nr:serine hydrolase domain-containing protein [Leadbetterella byssophila]ADQ18483.1 beta-lactamase [Leadbetterella byssophila DSM 17132]